MQTERCLTTTFFSFIAPLMAALAVGCSSGHGGSAACGAGCGNSLQAGDAAGAAGAAAADPAANDPLGEASTGGTDGASGNGTTGTGTGGAGSTEFALTLTPAGATLAKGTWQQYTATAVYTDGNKVDVTASATWNVSDPSLASVDAGGRVTGLAPGGTVISAALSGASAAVPVTVTDATLQSISLSPTNVAIPLLIDQPLMAIGIFSDMTQQDLTSQVTWSSTAPEVATVSPSGIAHAVAVGSTMIQASYGDLSAVTSLQVTSATLQYVDVEPALVSLAAGFTTQLTAVATFSDDSSFDVTGQAAWTSDSAAATFSGAPGLVTGVSSGTAIVTASFGGMSDSVSITVTNALLQALTIDPGSVSTAAGLTIPLTVTGSFSDGSTQDLTSDVAWSSSDAAVALVSNASGSAGLLSAISGGSATVTATLDGISASIQVSVTGAAITSIDVSAAVSQLPVGFKAQFSAVAKFDDGSSRDITRIATWTSSDTAVATVYTFSTLPGLVAGVSPGTVTIGAALGGHSGSASLTITDAKLTSIEVTPDSVTVAPGAAQQLTATGHFDDGSSLDLSTQCNWRSRQKSIASVTRSGLVTGRHAGDATILVRKGRFTDTASIHVQ